MIFNSYNFIIFFLPITILLYYAVRKICKPEINIFLLVFFSFVFCIFSNVTAIYLLIGKIAIDYTLYQLMSRANARWKKWLLVMGIGSSLLMLAYFKYFNFCAENINMLLHLDIDRRTIISPLGLSFITFQEIAFLVDVYKNKTEKCSILDVSLFLSWFPHVPSGPIIYFNEFKSEMQNLTAKINWRKFSEGIFLFSVGLAKKVLLADVLGKAVDWGYDNISSLNATSAIMVSLIYTLQIYFDFSGYCDMAIGISKMFMLNLPFNFNSPYKATDISDFWKRWHRTLTGFLTQYLYIPLGGSRKGNARTYINILIVFLCSGLWHGASWTFVLWGLLHGIMMVFNRAFSRIIYKIPTWITKLITLLFVNFTWIFFRAGTIETSNAFFRAIFQHKWGAVNENITDILVPTFLQVYLSQNIPSEIFSVMLIIILFIIVMRCRNSQEIAGSLKFSVFSAVVAVSLLIISVMSLSSMSSFIYALF